MSNSFRPNLKFSVLTRRLLLFSIFPLIRSQDPFVYTQICVILCAMFRIIFFHATKEVGVPGLAEELGGPKSLGGPNFSGGTSNPGNNNNNILFKRILIYTVILALSPLGVLLNVHLYTLHIHFRQNTQLTAHSHHTDTQHPFHLFFYLLHTATVHICTVYLYHHFSWVFPFRTSERQHTIYTTDYWNYFHSKHTPRHMLK